MSVTIQTGNSVTVQSGNRVTISAPGPQGPAGSGSSLPSDPGVDSVLFWDDSAGDDIWLGVSHGGNGSTDNDKVAIFGGNGSLTATNQLLIKSNGLTEPKLHLYNSANTQSVRVYAHTSLAASYDVEFPTAQTASNGLPWLQNTNGTSSFGQLNLTTGVTDTLPIANGGRGNSSNANVAYVRTGATGGTVGNAADPFPTIDAAKAAMTAPFIFDLDDGTHSLNLSVADLATADIYYFRGSGSGTIVQITCAGASGTPGQSVVFGTASPLVVQSDHSCVIEFLVAGGAGDDIGVDNGGNVNGRLNIKNAIADLGSILGGDGATPSTVSFTDLTTINCQVVDTSGYITSSLDSVINGAFYPNPAPGTSGNVLTSNGTTWTSATPATTNPAGSGSELQFRSSGSAFGAVTGSSVSGANMTLGGLLTVTQATANTGIFSSTGYSLTGSDATTMVNLAGTWNTTGTANGLYLDITNTASNAASKIIRAKTSTGSEFSVRADGRVFFGDPTNFGASIGQSTGSGQVNFYSGFTSTTAVASILGLEFRLANSSSLSFSSSAGTSDVYLHRDAAGVFAQRNGTNAQSNRLYDTYTSATDYHRLAMATVRISQTATAGATITLTGLIPDGAVVMGVTTKVTTALTGGVTGYQIGTGADPDRWGVASTATLGTTTDNRDWTNGAIECFTSATDVILTANGASFSGTGVIYVSIQYMTGQAD